MDGCGGGRALRKGKTWGQGTQRAHKTRSPTDLPDEAERIREYAVRNDRIRTEGTRDLLGAARAAGASRFLAQSNADGAAGRR